MTVTAYHTLGQWTIEYDRKRDEYHIFVDGHDLADCEIIALVKRAANAQLISAAPKLLAALRLAQSALNTAPRFRVGDTDSYKIAATVDKAIADATPSQAGGQP